MFRTAYRRPRASFVLSVRAVMALLMIGSLALANLGYPIYEVAMKKGDTPFPCQFSRCGCQTAEQCRTSCCCHSRQERVAWAVERGIDPDRVAVLTPEEKFQFTFNAQQGLKQKKSCCQTAKASCCSKAAQVAKCCETQRLGGSVALPNDVAAKKEAKALRWVLSISASKCKGTGVDWIQAGFVGQPPLRVAIDMELNEGRVASDSAPIYFSPVAEPLLRPV